MIANNGRRWCRRCQLEGSTDVSKTKFAPFDRGRRSRSELSDLFRASDKRKREHADMWGSAVL